MSGFSLSMLHFVYAQGLISLNKALLFVIKLNKTAGQSVPNNNLGSMLIQVGDCVLVSDLYDS